MTSNISLRAVGMLDDDRAPARRISTRPIAPSCIKVSRIGVRETQTLRQLHLVKSFAGPELAGYDAFFDFISKRLRGVHHHLPIVMHVTWLCIQDN